MPRNCIRQLGFEHISKVAVHYLKLNADFFRLNYTLNQILILSKAMLSSNNCIFTNKDVIVRASAYYWNFKKLIIYTQLRTYFI